MLASYQFPTWPPSLLFIGAIGLFFSWLTARDSRFFSKVYRAVRPFYLAMMVIGAAGLCFATILWLAGRV